MTPDDNTVNSQQSMLQTKVLVSDFDGTMTRYDFYKLALESLLPPNTPDHWADYRAGTITHFEALRRYFAEIRVPAERVLAVVKQMELDPDLATAIKTLRLAGWEVVVTSAGCEWYIRRLLEDAGVSVEVHSNSGRFVDGRGLLMELPSHSPFFSPTLGVDKAGVVQHFLNEGRTVAFAGDGFPDVEPARLVPEDLRFARSDLAEVLTAEGLNFHRFESWSKIANLLLQPTN